MSNEDYRVDEKIWAEYEFWPYHEAEWLILDIDPEHLENNQDITLSMEQEQQKRRARRAMDRLRERTGNRTSMPPLELIEHLGLIGLSFPERLVSSVREAVSRRVDPLPKRDEKSSGLRRSYNKLLSMYLAAAIDRYGWSPDNDTRANAQIIEGARQCGLPVDDHTVRLRLAEAVEHLTENNRQEVAVKLEVRPNQLSDWAAKKLASSPAK